MICKNNLGHTALIYEKTKVSYKQLFQFADNISKEIAVKNTKVAIFADNSLEWIYSFYAAWLNGCVVLPIEAGATIDAVAYIIDDSKPDIILTSNKLESNLKEAYKLNNHQPEYRLLEELDYTQVSDNFSTNYDFDKEKTAIIIYTSGTTGNPKGVMLSFKNLIANIRAVTTDVEIMAPNRGTLLLLPMHHVLPLVGSLLATLRIGGTVVMSPSMQSKHLMETLNNNQINIMVGVPRLYELIYNGLKAKIFSKFAGRMMFALAKLINSKAFSKKVFKKVHEGLGGNLEFMVCGGASLNTEVGSFYKVMGFEVLEGYAMTEAAPMIAFTRPGRVIIGSPGEILPRIEVKTIDNEIVVKGDNVMKGYLNKPKETAEAIKDGWLYTGDLGYIDKKGFVHITGRKKDLIVLPSGKNISPVELEMKLENESEAIEEAAVFMHNDSLHAIIIPDYNFLSKNEVAEPQAYFREHVLSEYNKKVSSYKRIMQFSLVKGELPRTRLGKVQRFKLADMITQKAEKSKRQKSEPKSEESEIIKKFIEQETSKTISLDDHIEYDIAMDSLGKLSLIDFIEKTFGVKIDENKLLSFPNVRSMVEHVKSHKVWQKLESFNWSETLKEHVNLKLPKSNVFMFVMKFLFKIFFKIYFNFKGEGYNKLPKGPCIIAPNHQSFFDGLFVISFIKNRTMKSTYFYAKKKHVNNGFLRFLAKWNNVIVVDLNNGLKESIQKLAEVLKQGKNIIIFPEGTRSKTGKLGEFKKMFAILSKELNVPVVPVAISGAYKALPRGTKFPRPFTKIKVRFLDAVYPKNYNQETLTEKVHNVIGSNLVV